MSDGRINAALLVEVFARIRRERMEGVPILNEAVDVAVTELVEHDDELLGILVTPWFINAVLIGDAGAPVIPGTKRRVALPAGPFEFIASHEPELGGFWMCSLFSPVLEFADHDTAMAAASAALAALLGETAPDEAVDPQMARIWRGEKPSPEPRPDGESDTRISVDPIAQTTHPAAPTLSRRGFLTARGSGSP